MPEDSTLHCSDVSRSKPSASTHAHGYFNHDIEFYVNPSSNEDETKNTYQDVSLSPSPQPAHTDTPTVDAFFTREVLVDAPPRSEWAVNNSTVETPLQFQATGSSVSSKPEFESRLSRVRRSLRQSISNLRVRRASAECHEPVSSPPTAGNKKTLRDYISKYSQDLPQQVTIEEGHLDTSYEFSVGEVFNLHFIKRTMFVDIRDHIERTSALVPVYGCVEYSLVYDPDGDAEKAKVGYTFQTVGNMLAKKTIPRVVCALESSSSGSERSSVCAREVLMVLKVKKRRFSGPPSLVVYSITKNARKVLNGGCAAQFTTNPIMTKLPMTLIMKHFSPDIFPCKGMMFMSGNHQLCINESWFSLRVTWIQEGHEKEGLQWRSSEQMETRQKPDILGYSINRGKHDGAKEQLASLFATIKDIQQQISNARSDFEASRAEVINLKQEVARMKSEIQVLRSQRSKAEDKYMTDEAPHAAEEVESEIRHMTVISPDSGETTTRL
ncbi:hypothetical protein EMCRGX_G010393 [Ephydatia muelleri]